LVEALQRREAGAREQLWAWVREPVVRLMDKLISRHSLGQDCERLVVNALHAVEIHLRTRNTAEFEHLSVAAFRTAILLRLAKLAWSPFGGRAGMTAGPDPLPLCPGYESRTLFRPAEQVGAFWFGGDWFGGAVADDGSLWVMVADVTGHGYYAYLLASHLPLVWRQCWHSPADGRQPTDLLAAVHDVLEPCLPDGVYIEASLARLRADGAATVAPAGGTRVLLRQGEQGRVAVHGLAGSWLGLCRPDPESQSSWSLAVGDELALASDGLYDQLSDYGAGRAGLDDAVAGVSDSETLFDGVGRLVNAALNRSPAGDDITMIALRRFG
jgi:serine phosphatase RsbU (regulator of sigma subunit)